MKNRSRTFKILMILIVLFSAWIIFAPFLAEYLIVEKPLERADAILVLGGSSVYVERTQHAARIFKQGNAPKIFLTDDGTKGGWNRTERRNPFFVEKARWELVAQGVPEDAIEILPGVVRGTDDEADLLIETAQKKNLNSILLVTSAYHTRRTLWTFEKAASKNDLTIQIGIESAPTGEQTPPQFTWWLSRTGWNLVAGEYLKGIYYWLFF